MLEGGREKKVYLTVSLEDSARIALEAAIVGKMAEHMLEGCSDEVTKLKMREGIALPLRGITTVDKTTDCRGV